MSRLGFALLVAAVGACDPATLKHTPDAAKHIDAPADAPDHGMVTVKLYDPNNPGSIEVGTPVVFIEADGTVVSKAATDTNGIATADVHANASATAIVTVSGGADLMTITGIQPGDNIILGQSMAFPGNGIDGTFTISWPAYSGATSYSVVGPCGTSSVGATTLSYAYQVSLFCKPTGPMDILVIPYGSSGPLSFLEKSNVTYTAGGSVALTGSYSFLSTFNATYTDVSAAIASIGMSRYTPGTTEGFGVSSSGAPANGQLVLSAQAPVVATTSQVETSATRNGSTSRVIQNLPGNALLYTLDTGATLLPWIGPVTEDFANGKLMVGVDTTGTTNDTPDLFFTNFAFSRSNGSGGTLSYRWLYFAHNAGDVTYPQLPADVGPVIPVAGDTLGFSFAGTFESSMLTWDMVRVAPFDTIGSISSVQDTSTRVRTVQYSSRGG